MKDTESLEDFYKHKYDLLPENFRKDLFDLCYNCDITCLILQLIAERVLRKKDPLMHGEIIIVNSDETNSILPGTGYPFLSTDCSGSMEKDFRNQ